MFTTVIARSEATKQSRAFRGKVLDYFATFAMTVRVRRGAAHAAELYSAASRISARSALAAQNLNSGILPNGSSAGLVNKFAAASA
jgi:hypothetical protein